MNVHLHKCPSCHRKTLQAGEPCLTCQLNARRDSRAVEKEVGSCLQQATSGKSKRTNKKKNARSEPVVQSLEVVKALGILESCDRKPPTRSRNERRSQGTASIGVVCILCGRSVAKGELLKHKAMAHGEMQVTPSPAQKTSANGWVNVVSGGLPGLGKRR